MKTINKILMMVMAVLGCVMTAGAEEDALCTATSSQFSLQTIADGSNVSGKILLQYSPLLCTNVVVQLDNVQLLSSTNSGSFYWQPQTLGSHTLKHIAGDTTLTCSLNVTGYDFEVQKSPNPPMDVVDTISITPTTRNIPVAGGSGAIITSGNGEWTAAASDPWISLDSTSGSAGSPVAYLVSANTNVEQRIGYVYVGGYTHTITQAGKGATISSSNTEMENDGGTRTITVTAENRITWQARPNCDWLSVSPTHGVGEDTVTVTVAPYDEVSTRQGTCTIAGNTYTVFQYGRRIKLAAYIGACDWYAHVIPITVNALAVTHWSVTPNNSWISIVDAGNGQGGDTVSIAIAENPSYAPRTGTVTIGSETFTVTQSGRTDLAFNISPATTTASVNGANGLISVNATPDLPWAAASGANWLTILNGFQSGAGNGNVVYSVSPNPTLNERTGTITITPEAASGMPMRTHTVTQPAQISTLSLSGYEFEAAGEPCEIEVTVANIVEWNVADMPSWITVGGSVSRVGPGTVTLTASANDTVYPREGTMQIAGHTFTVSQKARGVEVEYDNIVFDTDGQPKGGGVASFSVHPDGNVAWTAVASDSSWIVIYGTSSGTGDGEITYIIAPYVGTGEPRTGWIQVGDKKVYITQRAYDLTIDPYGEWVSGNAGAGEIGVSAGIGDVWNAIVTEPWITVVSGYDSGTGSGVVRFAYTENNTGKTRTGKIVIAGEAYTLTQAARIVVNVGAEVVGGGAVDGVGSYTMGEAVTLTAEADDGWEFAYWTLPDNNESMQNPLPITADVAKTVTAHFNPLKPDFTEAAVSTTEGVSMTWRNLAWATEYRIYRAPSSAKSEVPLVTLPANGAHAYTDTTGEIGITYWYWVEACGATVTNECMNPVSGAKRKPIVISPITYTNLRGATHSNTNQYEEETIVAFTPPVGGPVGYSFAGWNPAMITADMTGAQTIAATWTANSYSIKYNANGGSGTMDNTAMTYDAEGVVADNGFTYVGHYFSGWATNETGEVVYEVGSVVSNLTANAGGVYELWAVWEPCVVAVPTITPANGTSFGTPTCTVTLDCATEGATIYYRTGGAAPKASSTYLYSGPFTIDATTIVKAFATKDGWTKSATMEATITKIDMSLETALDLNTEVTVTTGGDEPWNTIFDNAAKVGDKSVQSGMIGDDEESWIQLAVTGAGTLTFWTKISCEADEPGYYGFDHLSVFVDGAERSDFRMDGESGWVQRTVTFSGVGSHTVKIVYTKDDSDSDGEDCAWLDAVVWTPAGAPPADPIPELPANATASDIVSALAGSADAALAAHIVDVATYNAYRQWADAVRTADGSAVAGHQAVKSSPYAWLAFALKTAKLIAKAPVQGDLKVERFESNSASGKYDFVVSLKDIEIGSTALVEHLLQVFGLEGASELGGTYSAGEVDIEFKTPSEGKLRFSAGPKSKSIEKFFMKVKMR